MLAQLGRQRAAEERGRRTPVLLLAVLSAGAFLWIMATWKTNVLQVSAGPVHELPCLGNSPVCLELKMKTIQFSARKDLILDAVFHSLKDNGIDGLKREEILQLTREAVEKVMKHDTWLPSWALKTMGATIDVERTSKSYGGNRWLSPFFSSAKPPETILQPDISAGNCWAFQGSRGHVVIRLPEKIWPTAFTIWHISKAVSPSGEVSTAPREFVVSGVDEDEGEALLGSFIYDVDGEIAQTFQVQEEPRKAFRQIKLEVRSNWGNKEYTCLYRADVHGNPEKA
ncbi:SUN domain-containing protein 3-like isoform X2 [Gallus gallus]|nr:SUN domain-containing protein 3-like isoform X4 [Gallus gallus]XP_040520875.1 SUN domain-containing protein 3-like [Gallus gallus]XP_040520877.1 SUN domain-containing protein 3-like isoform X2 [Gallus gallus]XP_040520880.1 SUN domain-containing protein 3-like isoform X3 [Gallus gallus]XP_040520984.1 SUN domain-containing protein 3-like isoform X2 [Gallus gallus]XP_040551966.1 SUN domain-containing protein 3-like isoform X1 [Gallus gallus]